VSFAIMEQEANLPQQEASLDSGLEDVEIQKMRFFSRSITA
jgi:hypothetical protein